MRRSYAPVVVTARLAVVVVFVAEMMCLARIDVVPSLKPCAEARSGRSVVHERERLVKRAAHPPKKMSNPQSRDDYGRSVLIISSQ